MRGYLVLSTSSCLGGQTYATATKWESLIFKSSLSWSKSAPNRYIYKAFIKK